MTKKSNTEEKGEREGGRKWAEIVQLKTVTYGMTRHMISTGTEVKSLPSGMQNVLDNGRLNCLRHLPPTTEARIGMHRIRIRIHKIPGSKSSQIWAYLGDGSGGRHSVVGVYGLSMGSKSRLLEMMMVEVVPRIRYELRYKNGCD